jgi:chromosome condensin MukBEF ATPase and DNA-binding subunit MukB
MTSREDLEFMNPNEIEPIENDFYSDKVKECLDNYQKSEFEQEAWEMLTESVDTMQSIIQKQLDELELIQDALRQSARVNTFAINKIQGVKNNLKKLI